MNGICFSGAKHNAENIFSKMCIIETVNQYAINVFTDYLHQVAVQRFHRPTKEQSVGS